MDPAAANAALPGPEREVLALLAESGFGYAAVGELLGLRPDAVAALAADARLRLATGAPDDVPDACRAQLPHLVATIDGEALASPDPAHLSTCPVCADALAAMRAAAAAYDAWRPPGMPDAVRARLRG